MAISSPLGNNYGTQGVGDPRYQQQRGIDPNTPNQNSQSSTLNGMNRDTYAPQRPMSEKERKAYEKAIAKDQKDKAQKAAQDTKKMQSVTQRLYALAGTSLSGSEQSKPVDDSQQQTTQNSSAGGSADSSEQVAKTDENKDEKSTKSDKTTEKSNKDNEKVASSDKKSKTKETEESDRDEKVASDEEDSDDDSDIA